MTTIDDQTLAKSLLKKQIQIQEQFLEQLKELQVPVDTRELERLLISYKATAQSIANIKPELDTSNLEATIKKSINYALNNSSIAKLADEVDTQTRAIERNNSLLSNGTGWQLKFWVILLTLVSGFMAGWGLNWYFEVPAKIAGVSKYQTLQSWYDGINNTMKDNCSLTKAYYKARLWDPKKVICGTLPLKTSQDLISGN